MYKVVLFYFNFRSFVSVQSDAVLSGYDSYVIWVLKLT